MPMVRINEKGEFRLYCINHMIAPEPTTMEETERVLLIAEDQPVFSRLTGYRTRLFICSICLYSELYSFKSKD